MLIRQVFMRYHTTYVGNAKACCICPDRVVDILEACGAFDPGSSPGRGVFNVFTWSLFDFRLLKSFFK